MNLMELLGVLLVLVMVTTVCIPLYGSLQTETERKTALQFELMEIRERKVERHDYPY